jgi:protein-disulfide isomerase
MNILKRILVISLLLAAPCYAEETAVREKSLLEIITEFFFPPSSSDTTLTVKADEDTAGAIKKVADREPQNEKGATVPQSSDKKPEKLAKNEEKKKSITKLLPEISLGKKDAPVVMINYSSLSCGHCAHFHTDTLPAIEQKYIKPGYLRIIFRDYPGDQVSVKAHQLAWCKGEMKYLDLLKILYAAQDKWLMADDPVAALKVVALQNGITPQQFDACLKNQELLDQIIALRLEGQKKYNIKATPTIVINAKIYQKALSPEEFDEIMQPLLAAKKGTTKG